MLGSEQRLAVVGTMRQMRRLFVELGVELGKVVKRRLAPLCLARLDKRHLTFV